MAQLDSIATLKFRMSWLHTGNLKSRKKFLGNYNIQYNYLFPITRYFIFCTRILGIIVPCWDYDPKHYKALFTVRFF